MIGEIVELLTGVLGVSGVQTGVLAMLAASGLYARKALGLGALVASWVRIGAAFAILLAIGLGTGVLEGVDVGMLAEGFRLLVDVLGGPLRDAIAVLLLVEFVDAVAELVVGPLEALAHGVDVTVAALVGGVA